MTLADQLADWWLGAIIAGVFVLLALAAAGVVLAAGPVAAAVAIGVTLGPWLLGKAGWRVIGYAERASVSGGEQA